VAQREGGRPVVIDLGERGTEGADERVDGAGGWVLWRRRARWLAAFVVVVLLAPLGGSAAPPAAPRLLWRMSAVNSFEVGHGLLYADDPVTRTLVAYRLSDGMVRWQREEQTDPQFFLAGGHPMITVAMPSGDTRLARLDPETGATTLTIADGMIGVTPDGSVISESDDERAARFIVLPPSGVGRRVVATVPYPAEWFLTPDNRVLTWVDAAGVLHVVDVLTGAEQVRDTGLRVPAPPAEDNEPPIGVAVVRDTFLVTARAEKTFTVAAFGQADLARRWVRTFARPAPRPDGKPWLPTAYGCGPFACVPTPGRTGTDVLDPADGRLTRHLDVEILFFGETRWQLTTASDDGLIVDLFDMETGTRPYPGWEKVADVDPQWYLMRRARRDATDFGAFDVTTGRLTRIGTLPGGYSGCKLEPPYLVCLKPGADTFLGVWRVPAL
jgi:hypothetical protein